MDLTNKSDVNECLDDGEESQTPLLNGISVSEEDSESELLLPCNKSCLSKKVGKPVRKVRWNDKNGKKLVEILEFQPSDPSDSDDDESESCFCIVM